MKSFLREMLAVLMIGVGLMFLIMSPDLPEVPQFWFRLAGLVIFLGGLDLRVKEIIRERMKQ